MKEHLYGKLMNRRWLLSQDGGRCSLHVDGVFQVLYDDRKVPVTGWGAYRIKNGKTEFYGKMKNVEDAVRFVQGEEVEVLTL